MQSFAPHLAVCTIRSLCLTEATNKPRGCFFPLYCLNRSDLVVASIWELAAGQSR